ncbi:MAG: hypothetical protein JWP87_1822 [Labilithrix sp.]|nr:hypothetical protein [Labilithrix sp.]
MTQPSLDIWNVKLANGETRALTLDELDAAFHDGWIDGRTLVLPAGAIRWAPLAEVAGLDDAPPPVSSVPNSFPPLALDTFGLDSHTGAALPLDFDAPIDADSDADLLALRPRRGRKIFGVLTAMIVVAGLGFAAFRAKPALQRALASRDGGGAARVAVEAKPVAPVQPPAPVVAAPARVPPPAEAVPTMSLTALPNAALTPAEEKKAAAEAKKAKRAPQKRAK